MDKKDPIAGETGYPSMYFIESVRAEESKSVYTMVPLPPSLVFEFSKITEIQGNGPVFVDAGKTAPVIKDLARLEYIGADKLFSKNQLIHRDLIRSKIESNDLKWRRDLPQAKI